MMKSIVTPIVTILFNFLLFLALSGVSFDGISVAAEDQLEDTLALLSEDIPARNPRIVNGEKSNPLSRSFYAKAGYDEYSFTSEILCGATLISSDIAITAA